MTAAIKLREADVQRACLQYLAAVGVMAWRNNTTGVYDPSSKRFRSNHSINGVADILGVLPDGRLLAVECKGTGGRVSEDQRFFLDGVRKSKGMAVVAYSIGDLEAALKNEGYQGGRA